MRQLETMVKGQQKRKAQGQCRVENKLQAQETGISHPENHDRKQDDKRGQSQRDKPSQFF